jgi:hypothetical protein
MKVGMKGTFVVIAACCVGTISSANASERGMELLGYLENWVDVKWWDNNMPGNCYQGCFEPNAFIAATKPYTALNYGFTFLTQHPDPDQLDCSGSHGGAKDPGCPVWDGEKIYMSDASKPFAAVVDSTTTVEKPTPGIVAITEAVRLARMHPDGPKRLKVTLGGWSDFARIGTYDNGVKVAKLAAKIIAWTFADGLDFDMEHFTPFNETGDEFGGLEGFVTTLRTEFDEVEKNWVATANTRRAALLKEYNAMQPWQQNNAKDFYGTSIEYLKQVASNPVPHLEISWCTRFNAFVPPNDPWNYALPGTAVPNVTYPTDNEGLSIWPKLGDKIDTVNIMAYDAGILKFNFTQILLNFAQLGNVPASKINMGLEPGEQYAGGHWEGEATDKTTGQWVKDNKFGGIMIWAVNPSPKQAPAGSVQCPKIAGEMQDILSPTFAWGPAPTYSKVDPSTGWLPNTPVPKPTPTPTPGPGPTPTPGPGPTPTPGNCAAAWGQCGGTDWKGAVCCSGTCTCSGTSAYSQCKPATGKWQC